MTEADLPKHCIKQLDVWCPEENAEEDGSIKSEESTSASNADDGSCDTWFDWKDKRILCGIHAESIAKVDSADHINNKQEKRDISVQ